jgi:hypothetical protein
VCKDLGKDDSDSKAGILLLETLDKIFAGQQMVPETNQAMVNISLELPVCQLPDPLDPNIDNHYIILLPEQKFVISTKLDQEADTETKFETKSMFFKTRKIAFDLGLEENEWIYEDDFEDFDDEDGEEEDGDPSKQTEWEYWDDTKVIRNPKSEIY